MEQEFEIESVNFSIRMSPHLKISIQEAAWRIGISPNVWMQRTLRDAINGTPVKRSKPAKNSATPPEKVAQKKTGSGKIPKTFRTARNKAKANGNKEFVFKDELLDVMSSAKSSYAKFKALE